MKTRNNTRYGRLLITIFLSVSALILGAGHFYISSQQADIKKQKENQLYSIADLQVERISEWLNRIDLFTEHIITNPFLSNRFEEFLNNPQAPRTENHFDILLKTTKEAFGYKSLFFCKPDGGNSVALNNKQILISPEQEAFCMQAYIEKRVVFSNFYKNSSTGEPQLSYHVPVYSSTLNGEIFGVLNIIIDPEEYLYPLLQRWPVASASGESFIATHKENKIIYLTQLRFLRNSALNLVLDDTLTDLPANRGAHGEEGIFEGKDYRETEVLSVVKKIPGTDWFLVAKEDKNEIFYESDLILKSLSLSIFALLALAGVAVGFVWNRQGKQQYQKLYHSEHEKRLLTAHLENITRYANDIIILMDSSGNILQVNNRAVETYGYTHDELLTMNGLELVAPNRRENARNYISKLTSSFGGVIVESEHIKKDGTVFSIENSSRGIAVGDNVYIQAIIRDITERKNAEKELKEREKRYREIFETTSDLIQVIAPDGKILFANKAWKDVLGYEDEDLKELRIDHLIHPDFLEQCISTFKRSSSGEKIDHIENKLITKNGQFIDVDGSVTCTFEHGKPQRITCFMRDITQRKKAEDLIRFHSYLLNQIGEAVIATDIDGRITYWNKAAEKLYGWNFKEVINRNILDVTPSSATREEAAEIMECLSKGECWSGEFTVKRKDGSSFPAVVTDSPVFDSNKKLIGIVGISMDVSEKKKLLDEMSIAKEKAEEMNRLKTNLLSNMSHELRTPLVGILGCSNFIYEESSDTEFKSFAKTIYLNGKRLLETLNSILDLSIIESKAKTIDFEKINPAAIIEEITRNYRETAEMKGLELKMLIKNNSIFINIDTRMFRQVLANLLSNAIKFTPKGIISVELETITEGNRSWCLIKISDTGIGIAESEMNKMFQVFRQLSNGFSRSFEGLGVGLYISQKFVRMMNGEILVQSEVNKGTTFTLKFQSFEEKFNEGNSMTADNLKYFTEKNTEMKLRVLFVDDDETSRSVVKLFFRGQPFEITTADGYSSAMEILERDVFDLFLLDINLSTIKTGFDIANEIRKMPHHENAKIIAVTALAMRGDEEKILSSGFTHYISKPFVKDKFLEFIRNAISN